MKIDRTLFLLRYWYITIDCNLCYLCEIDVLISINEVVTR